MGYESLNFKYLKVFLKMQMQFITLNSSFFSNMLFASIRRIVLIYIFLMIIAFEVNFCFKANLHWSCIGVNWHKMMSYKKNNSQFLHSLKKILFFMLFFDFFIESRGSKDDAVSFISIWKFRLLSGSSWTLYLFLTGKRDDLSSKLK